MIDEWLYNLIAKSLRGAIYIALYGALGLLMAYGYQGVNFEITSGNTWSIILVGPIAGLIVAYTLYLLSPLA